jgi:hypothetical protein
MDNNIQILGSHKGINLIAKEDGSEFYYSTKTGKCAIGIRGIARLLGCSPRLIHNVVNRLTSGAVVDELMAEVYTQSGIQGVRLILETDLPKILTELSTGKAKKETREAAIKLQETFAHAGFRLMVLLEVAPELVAKEAINLIKSPEKAREVAACAEIQAEYLESYRSLGEAGKACGFEGQHYAQVNGHNNKLVGIPNGDRPKAPNEDKVILKMLQDVEKLKLIKKRKEYKNAYHAANSACKAGTELAKSIQNILA